MFKIIGIDPGSLVTGFGVIQIENDNVRLVGHGVIDLKTGHLSFHQRLFELSKNLNTLFLKYQPTHVAIEKIFLGKNPDSAFKLGHARGLCIAAALAAKCQVAEYATRVVKKGVVGSGNADKNQVAQTLKFLLKIPHFDYFDASDALALAYYHAQQIKLKSILDNNTKKENQL